MIPRVNETVIIEHDLLLAIRHPNKISFFDQFEQNVGHETYICLIQEYCEVWILVISLFYGISILYNFVLFNFRSEWFIEK